MQTSSSSTDVEEIKNATELMAQDDANEDGVLAIEETPLTQEIFDTADSDGDGYLDQEKLEAYIASAPEGGAGPGGPWPLIKQPLFYFCPKTQGNGFP